MMHISQKSPEARFSYALTYDEHNQESILFGGFAPGVKFNDTWSWNGCEWKLLSHNGPAARDSAAITFDSRRKCVFLFGGHIYNDRFDNDTWQWKDNKWTLLVVAGPSARNHSSMIFVPHIDKTVLFGGRSKIKDLGDTWTWDGNSWQLLDIPGPSPRDGYRMVYDSIRNKIVLFGGRTRAQGKLSQLGDTWEFNGSRWTQVSDSGPEARSHPGMAHDRKSGQTILFGGLNNSTPFFDDQWQWDGTEWKELVTTAPTPRARITLVPQQNGKILLFGGASSFGPLQDTWEWDSKQMWRKRFRSMPLNERMKEIPQ